MFRENIKKMISIKEYFNRNEEFSKDEIIKYIKRFYHPLILKDLNKLLEIQGINAGEMGINDVYDYTDGYMNQGDLIYLVFNNNLDFKHISYKNSDFFTEVILKFDNNILIDFYVNGDDLPLQYFLCEIFKNN